MSQTFTITLDARELQIVQDVLVAALTVVHPQLAAGAQTPEIRQTIEGWFKDTNRVLSRFNDLLEQEEPGT